MSSSAKITIAVVAVLIIAAGAYYFFFAAPSASAPAAETGMTPQEMQEMGSASTSDSTAMPAGSSASDASLTQDTAAIDAQMSGLNSDNANMSATDQPVSQSY